MSREERMMKIENRETITFYEFQMWLAGLIRGKQGAIPDLEDWRLIKKMLDKVEPEKEIVKEYITVPSPREPDPSPWPSIPNPVTPYPNPISPSPTPWVPWKPWEPSITPMPNTPRPYVWTSDGTGSPPPMFGSTTDRIEMNGDSVESNANVWESGKVNLMGAITNMVDVNTKKN